MSHIARSAETLARCVEQGEALRSRASMVGDRSDYESWKTSRAQWVELTANELVQVYGGPERANELRAAASFPGHPEWQSEYANDVDAVGAAIDFLISLRQLISVSPADITPPADGEPDATATLEPQGPGEQASDAPFQRSPERSNRSEPPQVRVLTAEPVPLAPVDDDYARDDSAGSTFAPEAPPAEYAPARENGASAPAGEAAFGQRRDHSGKRVFLVHGIHEGWKQRVVSLLQRTGPHEVTILHERPDEGRTLVGQTAGTGYAIVLLTADEVGAPRLEPPHEPYYTPRARQSVVFEMGLLVGVLTPRYVCVLYERGVELPSDVHGLAYVLLDMAGAWQAQLLMHLRGAGFDYDVARLAAA